jgi:hypothetical protein
MKPTVDSLFAEDSFLVSYTTHYGRISFSGDYSGIIEIKVQDTLLDLAIDSHIPFLVGYLRNTDSSTTLKVFVPAGRSFFEEDFSGLNTLLFGIKSKDFVFSLD